MHKSVSLKCIHHPHLSYDWSRMLIHQYLLRKVQC